MAQHITVQVFSENGQTVKLSNINFAPILKAVMDINDYQSKFPWLSTIDEYGNPYFNHLQLPHVLKELAALKQQAVSNEVSKEVIALLDFTSTIENHYYIKFIGD